jgi:hypothetical protein
MSSTDTESRLTVPKDDPGTVIPEVFSVFARDSLATQLPVNDIGRLG